MKNVNGCNWMGCIDGSKSIAQLNIPGTHNSGTQYVECNTEKYYCQNLSIEEQLKIGIRYLDIRCYIAGEMKIPQIRHSKFNCLKTKNGTGEENCLTLEDVLQTAITFLEQNNTETILFQVKNEDGNDKKLVEYIAAYLIEKNQKNILWSEDRIPTLSEVRGKLVLVRRFTYSKNHYGVTEKSFGINLSSWDSECHAMLKAASNTFVNVNNHAFVQDRYLIGGEDKYKLIIRAIDEANKTGSKPFSWWDISLTSCVYNDPKSAATAINKRLMEEPMIRKGNKLGTFVMDFVNKELVEKVYLTNTFIN